MSGKNISDDDETMRALYAALDNDEPLDKIPIKNLNVPISEDNKLEKEATEWKDYFLEHETSYKNLLNDLPQSDTGNLDNKYVFVTLFVESGNNLSGNKGPMKYTPSEDGKWYYRENTGNYYKYKGVLENLDDFKELFSQDESLSDYLNKDPPKNEVLVFFNIKSNDPMYGYQIEPFTMKSTYNKTLYLISKYSYESIVRFSNFQKELDYIYSGEDKNKNKKVNNRYNFTTDITKNTEKIGDLVDRKELKMPKEWSRLDLKKFIGIIPVSPNATDKSKPIFNFIMSTLNHRNPTIYFDIFFLSPPTSLDNITPRTSVDKDNEIKVKTKFNISKDSIIELIDYFQSSIIDNNKKTIGNPYRYYYNQFQETIFNKVQKDTIRNISRIVPYKNICMDIMKSWLAEIKNPDNNMKEKEQTLKDYLFVYLELFKATATLLSYVGKYTRLRFFYLLFKNPAFNSQQTDTPPNFVNFFISILLQTFTDIVFYRFATTENKPLDKDAVTTFIKKYYKDIDYLIDEFFDLYLNEIKISYIKDTGDYKNKCFNITGQEDYECTQIFNKQTKKEFLFRRRLWNTYAHEELTKGSTNDVEASILLPFLFYANNIDMDTVLSQIPINDTKKHDNVKHQYAFLICCIRKYKYTNVIDKNETLGTFEPSNPNSNPGTPRNPREPTLSSSVKKKDKSAAQKFLSSSEQNTTENSYTPRPSRTNKNNQGTKGGTKTHRRTRKKRPSHFQLPNI